MNLDALLALPTKEWAGSLVSLSLAIVSAAAAIYSGAVVPWAAELASATRAMVDKNGKPLDPAGTDGARARARLEEVRAKDPAKGIGLVALALSVPMTFLGIIAGLQVPGVGYLYTVFPIALSAGVAIVAAVVPGRTERHKADARLKA
jgi:hypothetical protein